MLYGKLYHVIVHLNNEKNELKHLKSMWVGMIKLSIKIKHKFLNQLKTFGQKKGLKAAII